MDSYMMKNKSSQAVGCTALRELKMTDYRSFGLRLQYIYI